MRCVKDFENIDKRTKKVGLMRSREKMVDRMKIDLFSTAYGPFSGYLMPENIFRL